MGQGESDPRESGFQERDKSDRRSHIDRRSNIAPWTGTERRIVNRRQAIDRRGLPHGVFYKANGPLKVLYGWLRDNCYGKWSVGHEKGGPGTTKKTVKVLFELESDKANFLETVVRE